MIASSRIWANLKNHQQDMSELLAQPVESASPSNDMAALDRLGDLFHRMA